MQRLHKRNSPEAKIQQAIIEYLKIRDWVVMPTHGNMFQQGFPDLYALHHLYGAKWIEVKNPSAYSFTPAQKRFFPVIHAACEAVGSSSYPGGVWILTAANDDEYKKLFKKPNWYTYMIV